MTAETLPQDRLADPRIKKRGDLRRAQKQETVLAGLLSILAEGLLTLGVASMPALWPVWLLGHVVVSAILIFWAHRMRRRRRARRFPALLAICTATLGLAGAIGVMFAALGQRAYRSEARSFQVWYYTLFPPRTQRTARAWYDLSQALGDEDSGGVESFTDLIRYGEIDQKLAVVALLARRFDPRFAPALHAALNDPDPTVRVQAATAAAHIEDDFVDRWVVSKRRADARKSDPAAQMELAELLDACAFTDILDERREAELRREAESQYRRVIEIEPRHARAHMLLGRLLLRTDRPRDALAVLRPLEADLSPEAAGWLMEALFQLGQFDELKRVINEAPDGVLPDRLAASAALWHGDLPPAPHKPAPAQEAAA